jgi:hypothetical protein
LALRLLIGASAIFVVLTAGLYAWTLSWAGLFPRDGPTLIVGRDFLNFWMYGRAARTADPSRFYDPLAYRDALAALLGPAELVLSAERHAGRRAFGRLPYLAALLC